MLREHTVQELQAFLLTMVMVFHIISIENWEELTPRGMWQ